MIFNVDQDDYLPLIIDEAGIRLIINQRGVEQSSWTSGISVATGFKTDIALRKVSLNKQSLYKLSWF